MKQECNPGGSGGNEWKLLATGPCTNATIPDITQFNELMLQIRAGQYNAYNSTIQPVSSSLASSFMMVCRYRTSSTEYDTRASFSDSTTVTISVSHNDWYGVLYGR